MDLQLQGLVGRIARSSNLGMKVEEGKYLAEAGVEVEEN